MESKGGVPDVREAAVNAANGGGSAARASELQALSEYHCEACGRDLTPTDDELHALRRFGNPLRRPPCLETEDGLHVISDDQLEDVAWERRSRVR